MLHVALPLIFVSRNLIFKVKQQTLQLTCYKYYEDHSHCLTVNLVLPFVCIINRWQDEELLEVIGSVTAPSAESASSLSRRAGNDGDWQNDRIPGSASL
jgi:hypothetical protein